MNKKLIFGIYDTKAQYFKHVFFMLSKGEAIRGFSDIANDSQSEIGKHPEDFIMFFLGELDSNKGTFENLEKHENLGLASDYKKVQNEPQIQ